jgi:site-specific DNA recombinase
VEGANGKRVIVPDPETAPLVTELFERFATGRHSLKAVVAAFQADGMTLRGRKLQKSVAHQILRKRIYMGEFD